MAPRIFERKRKVNKDKEFQIQKRMQIEESDKKGLFVIQEVPSSLENENFDRESDLGARASSSFGGGNAVSAE